jgi:lipopolysaccharide transport system permease protein
MAAAPTIITGNPNFVKKVIFPLEILPAAAVGAAFLRMAIGLMLWLIGVGIFGGGLHWQWLWLLILLPPFVFLVLGIAWMFAAIGVFVQDLSQLVAFLVQVAMYASGVFYSAERITPFVWQFLRFNPLLLIIELARNAVLWHQAINIHHLIYTYLCGLAVCYIGHSAFHRMRPAFADVL